MPVDIDILEDKLWGLSPDLLLRLLKDQTLSTPDCQHNIFWATTDYEGLGKGYEYSSQILPELITGEHGHVIMPRVLKAIDMQRDRSRVMAEVFTPSWVCNVQNNLIDNDWFGRKDIFNEEKADHTWEPVMDRITFPEGKTWRDYVGDIRLEITCGEAPYLVSRYDATTGDALPLPNRIGLLDRKLRVVSENADAPSEWLKWALVAFQSCYGYEWQGDSLLLARENMLISFIDYYREKFGTDPSLQSLLDIAEVISWNLWQMDGLKGVVPGTCRSVVTNQPRIMLETERTETPCRGCAKRNLRLHNGTYCIIRDWSTETNIRFIDLIK